MTFTTLCQALMGELAKPKTRMFMNLTAVLLLVGCLQVTAGGFSQNVSISRKDVPLENVFREIKKQTGYSFFYKAGLLQNSGNVSIDVKNAPLDVVIEGCLKGLNLWFSIVNKTIVIMPQRPSTPDAATANVAPAFMDVHGEIKDAETGEHISGANISVKNSKVTVTSDANGQFALVVNEGAILVITYVGYEKKEITVKSPMFIQVLLTPVKKESEELVVTGYQELKKDSYTGNPTVVTGAQLKNVNPSNILRSLQVFDPSFKIAENTLTGSNPNRLPTVTVRGTTSLPEGTTDAISKANLAAATNLPTFILDGYEVTMQKVYDLDINRVKSITILKDAAATAIYGSRAANGVIVIATKPPRKGKLQLSYNYELTVNAADLSQYNVLNAAEKLEYEELAGLYNPTGNGSGYTQTQLDELYYHKKKNIVGGVNTYWLSQPVRSSFSQKHSAYIEGGDNTIRYGLALRYETQPGVMKGSSRDRYSTEMSLSYSPSTKFQFRNVISATIMNSNESNYGSFSEYARMNPYYIKTDSTGKIIQKIDEWRYHQPSGENIIRSTLSPLYNSTLGGFDKSNYFEFIDNLTTDWNISKYLRLHGVISFNQTRSTADKFVSPFDNEYYESTAYKVGERGRYGYATNTRTTVDGTVSLSYFRQFGFHAVNLFVASNIKTDLSRYRSVLATGFTNDKFTDIGYATTYAKETTPYSNVDESRLAAVFASLNYSYNNKYLMDITVREDGSSKFGSENKIAPFASIGLGWNIHRELFLQNTAISRLKFRASAGTTGSVSFSSFMAKTTYNYDGTNQYSTGIGAIVGNYGNNLLQWQKTRNLDVGFELGLFKDRIVLLPRYYYKLTRGLVADVALAPSTGFTAYKDNVGDMRNTGYELGVQASIIRGKDLNLNLTANLIRNDNIIVKISNSLKAYNDRVDKLQDSTGYKGAPLTRYKEGQSTETLYAVRSLGIDPENGSELFVKKDGKTITYSWDVRDIVPVGVSTPRVEGSVNPSISYKQFNLQLYFFTHLGGKQYNQTLVDRVENADPRFNVDRRVFSDKWKNRTDYTYFKNITDLGSTDVTSRFIQTDNVVDLRSLYFSYDVNKSLYSKIGASSFTVAFTMNDVWRWSSITQERGIDYPFARSFTLSLRAGF